MTLPSIFGFSSYCSQAFYNTGLRGILCRDLVSQYYRSRELVTRANPFSGNLAASSEPQLNTRLAVDPSKERVLSLISLLAALLTRPPYIPYCSGERLPYGYKHYMAWSTCSGILSKANIETIVSRRSFLSSYLASGLYHKADNLY